MNELVPVQAKSVQEHEARGVGCPVGFSDVLE